MGFRLYNELDYNKLVIGWLNTQSGIGNVGINKLLEYFETPKNIWTNLKDEIDNINFLRCKKSVLNNLIDRKEGFEEKFIKKLNEEHVTVVTILDDEYPKKLRNINNPPCLLYCKGDIKCLNDNSIAVVGSRKATDYGKWCANKLTGELAKRGITIVSGLAYGIDSIAHRTALDNNVKTIGVIGSGINIIYPIKNEKLYKDIEENDGLIISEYPFDSAPISANFPNRNRIISGLSCGVLIIEAQDKSGTLITASHALEQGKDVFCVPGNINSIFSVGTNKLIRDGAKLVIDVNDILDEIHEFREIKNTEQMSINFDGLNQTEKDIINMLKLGVMDINILCNRIEQVPSRIMSYLSILEMKGIIKQTSPGKYIIS